jgi:hypothetical protein
MTNYVSNLIDMDVWLVQETKDAVLVDHSNNEKEMVWLPKSQVEITKRENLTYTRKLGGYVLTLPEWLAKEKEMI